MSVAINVCVCLWGLSAVVSRSQTLAGRRVWSTAHIRLVPTPTPTGVGDKCLCGHSVYIMPL